MRQVRSRSSREPTAPLAQRGLLIYTVALALRDQLRSAPNAVELSQLASSSTTNESRRRRSGFTLADLSVTVLIIGILSTVAAPKFAESLHDARVDAAALRIKADLKLARDHAINASATVSAQFDPVTDSYLINGLPDLDHPDLGYRQNVSDYPYNADLTAVSFGGDTVVQFDRYGQPDSGGMITVQSGRYALNVSVDPDTGRATVE